MRVSCGLFLSELGSNYDVLTALILQEFQKQKVSANVTCMQGRNLHTGASSPVNHIFDGGISK